MLCSNLCFLNTSGQLRSVLPELRGFRCSSSLLGARLPLDPQFVFIRSLGWLFVPLGVANLTTEFPGLLPMSVRWLGGNNLQWSRDWWSVSRFRISYFSRLSFTIGNSPLTPVSPHNRCLIASCSQLHSPRIELGRCGQIGSHTWVWQKGLAPWSDREFSLVTGRVMCGLSPWFTLQRIALMDTIQDQLSGFGTFF